MREMLNSHNVSRKLLLIGQRHSASGLVRQLYSGLSRVFPVELIDCRARWQDKWWSALTCFHYDRKTWLRRRWETGLYSVKAWHRNTIKNGRYLDRISTGSDLILQVGGYYGPHPDYKNRPYSLFITYPMILCYRDGTKPWVPPKKDRAAFLALEKDLYQYASHIFVNAHYVRQCLIHDYGVEEHRIVVTGLGVDAFYLANQRKIPDTFMYNLLFVGYDFGYKGGATLLEGFLALKRVIPQMTLTVVGAEKDQLPALPEGVRLTGRLESKEALLACYRNADIFVMPSLCDSFGFVFLEAMTQGVPCVGANINAMPEIIQDGETGYIVPPRDADALAAALLKYYSDAANRRQMGEAAAERVRREYTWDNVITQIISVWS